MIYQLRYPLDGVSLSAPVGILQIPPGTMLTIEARLGNSRRFTRVLWADRRIDVFDADLEACGELLLASQENGSTVS